MSEIQKMFLATVMADASLAAYAQTTEVEHAQHHPQGAALVPVAAQPSAQPSVAKPA